MGWFSVRCIIRFDDSLYEERITLWEADSFTAAIQNAEAEVADYAEGLDGEYLGVAQAYECPEPPSSGAEVFSLIRQSSRPPAEYLETFFDTGMELQAALPMKRKRHEPGER